MTGNKLDLMVRIQADAAQYARGLSSAGRETRHFADQARHDFASLKGHLAALGLQIGAVGNGIEGPESGRWAGIRNAERGRQHQEGHHVRIGADPPAAGGAGQRPRHFQDHPFHPNRGGDSPVEQAIQQTKAAEPVAKLRAFQFRDIRPKAASEMDLEHASKLLGHTEHEITEKVYRRVGETVKPTK